MAVKVPTFDRLIKPCFRAIKALGGSASNEEIYDEVVRKLALSEAVLEVQQSGHIAMSKVAYNLAWARTYLKKFGAIVNTARSVWTITSEFSDVNDVDAYKVVEFVRNLEAQSANIKAQHEQSKNDNALGVSEDEEPEEISSWRVRMLEILQNMNPYGFERFVQLLLRN